MHKTLNHRTDPFPIQYPQHQNDELGKLIPFLDLKLPVFFPSISSVKTNLKPVEYLKLLVAVGHPQFLVSAHDLFYAPTEDKEEIHSLLVSAKRNGQIVLLDSGNYEAYWHKANWSEEMFFSVLDDFESFSVSFSFDEQSPPPDVEKICQITKERAGRHLEHIGDAIYSPIIHAPKELLSDSVVGVAQSINPQMIAVPERLLGHGVLERIVTLRNIRKQLNKLDRYRCISTVLFYCSRG
ncbi:hypothetical protein [Pontiella sulfatireligans]|uniref:Uncharacterized protein n=1 Tax=Pontiella sulfatireligans TaxID=2750658 RepID=A0A6C2UM58_9BACT|nr:hypothetical protein [Pontiella sulfatireligans]VGO21069.1 hypothetical protein SCARR_03138 [Pontiella sulfatireligans]